MSVKQDKHGVRTASELEQKYSFGKSFAEILGLITDTRDHVDSVESVLRGDIEEVETTLRRNAEEIVMEAKKTITNDIENYKKEVEAQFGVQADVIGGMVSATEERLREENGELRKQIETITKYFSFTIDGLTIGALDENGNPAPNKVVIDNDDITIYVKDVPIQTFKADGSSLIPSLKLTKGLNLLGLNITADDTHINCDTFLKIDDVGGE